MRAGVPPAGVRIIEREASRENADPYRNDTTPVALLEAELEHQRRHFGPGVLGFALSLVAMIGRDRVGDEMRVFFAVVGVLAIVFSLIPRRRDLRFIVTEAELSMGREGVPRSRWTTLDANLVSEVFIRAQTRTEEAARDYELVVALEDGSAHVLVAPVRHVDAAVWLAIAMEDALRLEGSSMQAREVSPPATAAEDPGADAV